MIDVMREMIENPEEARPIHLYDLDAEGEQENIDNEEILESLDTTELTDDEEARPKNIKSDGPLFAPVIVDEEEKMLQDARKLSFEQRIAFDKIIAFCKSVLRSNKGAAVLPIPPQMIVTGKEL